jgi:hypothetical protein
MLLKGRAEAMNGKRQRLPLYVLAAGLLGLFVGSAPFAATITVNSLADPGQIGVCALHDAITAANTMTATNGCGAGNGHDTIKFRVTGTITLGSALPEVTDSQLTVTGPAAPGITIDGGNLFQVMPGPVVLVMQVAAGATLNLNHLTIDGGGNLSQPQGAQVMQVATGATLNLNHLTIADGIDLDAFGAGIQNSGTVTIVNSLFFGNNGESGGGIFNEQTGTLTVTNSTFSHNVGIGGGGINNLGKLTVTNSTFSSNGADVEGGAILNSGTLTVTNSTFAGNSTSPAPIPGPGGGIYNAGFASLKNTILANNSGNCSGTIIDAGYDISDDASCGFGKTGSAHNGDGVDPLLFPAGLADNGGPTETIALQSGSPAIDAIPVTDCSDQASPPNPITSDQRGLLRPDDGEQFCDIGAYEFQDFAGTPGQTNCYDESSRSLMRQFGNLDAAASVIGYSSLRELQNAIAAFCKG